MEETTQPAGVKIDFTSLRQKREQPHLHCQCGCADADPASIVGWCLWCGHGYVEYSPKIENHHSPTIAPERRRS